jgi:hypothetical protein
VHPIFVFIFIFSIQRTITFSFQNQAEAAEHLQYFHAERHYSLVIASTTPSQERLLAPLPLPQQLPPLLQRLETCCLQDCTHAVAAGHCPYQEDRQQRIQEEQPSFAAH